MKHRSDIDGLRAFAVLPITLFHAGIPGFSGGFVGVDIFFVISGFLITGILVRDMEDGRFNYVDFYERRLRRIFPALFVMLAASCVAAYFLILPSEMRSFGKSVIGAIAFFANIVFYREAGYFDDSAEEKPLLHTWSLGVEEQFYIFFPIILFIVLRYWPRWRGPILAAIAAISLALCVVFTLIAPDAAFYLIPMRAWELLAGSLLALGCYPRFADSGPLGNRGRGILALAGLAMILVATFRYDSQMAFPGYVAILPVLGSALVIGYGQGTIVDRILSWRPFVFFGLISYSLYLWHWPIIVFGRKAGQGELGIETAIGYLMASIIAGYLSWRFVEGPFRNRSKFTRKQIFASATICAAALIAVAGFAVFADLGKRSFSEQMLAFDAARDDVSPHRDRCHLLSGIAPPEDACVLGDGPAEVTVWADSHGVEIAYALHEAGLVVRSLTYSSCPPGMFSPLELAPDCGMHNQAVLHYLLTAEQSRIVFMAAYYPQLVDDTRNRAQMRDTVRRLMAAGYSVFILSPSPHENDDHFDLPRQLVRGGDVQLSVQDYETEHQEAISFLKMLEGDGATILWTAELMCSAGDCPAVLEGRPVLFDSHHLSMSAARYLAGYYAPQLQSAVDSTDERGRP